MPGLLDIILSGGYDDSESGRNAQMALAAGLLGGRGSFSQSLGGAMNSAQDVYRSSKKDALQSQLGNAELQKIQREAQKLADDEAERKRRLALNTQFRAEIPAPQGPLGPNTSDYGPTVPGRGPVDPIQSLMFKAMQAEQMTPIDYAKTLIKDRTPISLPAGAKLLESDTYRVLADNPKADKEHALIQLMEAAGIDPASPQGKKILSDGLTKATTHPPSTTMNQYGGMQPGVDLKTGKPAFGVTDKQGNFKVIPGFAPPEKDVPANIKAKIAENNVEIGKIRAAIKDVDANPNSFGLQNWIGDTAMQRMDAKGVKPRARVAAIGAVRVHDMAGASQAVQEVERLKPYIPNVNDRAPAIKEKLELLEAELVAMQQELTQGKSLADVGKAKPKASSVREAADAIIKGQ